MVTLKRFCGTALFILFLILSAGLMTSCGSSSAEENRIEIRSNGTIIADSFAEFPKEQYNLTLFEEEAKASVKAYNEAAGSTRIRFVGVTSKEGIAHLTMRYRSYEDYREFNHQDLYYGTVQDGLESLDLEGGTTLKSPDGTKSVTLRKLGTQEKEGEARWRIVAVKENVLVLHKGTPAYISSNVVIDEDGSVRTNADPGEGELPQTAYIVYKK
ncbi:MAG: hypothetical protein E7240_02600 [Lachnospiraceae bacterium]|nr:hypothetical protein [Lachnospiraceae bacterium]